MDKNIDLKWGKEEVDRGIVVSTKAKHCSMRDLGGDAAPSASAAAAVMCASKYTHAVVSRVPEVYGRQHNVS